MNRNGELVDLRAPSVQMRELAMSQPRRSPGAVAHQHHWSVYLVFASFSLLVAGLASDPRFLQFIRDWFLRR